MHCKIQLFGKVGELPYPDFAVVVDEVSLSRGTCAETELVGEPPYTYDTGNPQDIKPTPQPTEPPSITMPGRLVTCIHHNCQAIAFMCFVCYPVNTKIWMVIFHYYPRDNDAVL